MRNLSVFQVGETIRMFTTKGFSWKGTTSFFMCFSSYNMNCDALECAWKLYLFKVC